MPPTPTTVSINVSELDGSNGFRLDGGTDHIYAGKAVGAAGDVNGDGYADVIIGAEYAGVNGVNSGAAHVVFGGSSMSTPFDLAGMDGSNGFIVYGESAGDFLGISVSAAGDLNGDGYADLIVGARGKHQGSPEAYAGGAVVVFGHSQMAATLELSDVPGSNGFLINGVCTADYAGRSVSGGGDVNGDGIDDLLIGAYGATGAYAQSGAAYVIFGQSGAYFPQFGLTALDGCNGFQILGAISGEHAGFSVSIAGDVNGDGVADMIIGTRDGALGGDYSGAAYVVFGGSGFASTMLLSDLTGGNGFAIAGAPGDLAGRSVSGAGDINGDGFADLIVGAAGASANGSDSGASYVIFGRSGGFAAQLDLTALSGSDGFRLDGVTSDDASGRAVSGAGDVNGDGIDDLLVGAPKTWSVGPYSGSAYVVFGHTGAFDAVLQLSGLDGSTGFRIDGETAYGYAGLAVAGVGDVNGDGAEDILVGAPGAGEHGVYNGRSYVIYGASGAAPPPPAPPVIAELSNVDGINGFRLDGFSAGEHAGWSVSGAGDVNGDGLADIIVGAPDSFGSGRAYVVFGSTGAYPRPLETGDLDGSVGFVIEGASASSLMGFSVDAAGDINGDGIGDLIIGAPHATGDNPLAGVAYLVFGSSGGFPATLNIDEMPGSIGVMLVGHRGNGYTGTSVSRAGDVNGDGIDDLLVGAYRTYGTEGRFSGTTYVVFGHTGPFAGPIDLSALNGEDGYRLVGAGSHELSGYSVAAAGDVNGDGIDDIVIGALASEVHGVESGRTYVVFGHGCAQAPEIDLGSLDGSTGFIVNGVTASDLAGISVSGAGDINGDGYADVVIGASNAGTTGAAYVIFGQSGGFAATLELSDLDGANGFTIQGVCSPDMAGRAVSAAGDVNGDGIDDLLVGAPGFAADGAYSGATYVILGHSGTFDGFLQLSALDGNQVWRIDGESAGDRSGLAVGAAGDVNGDGIDDIVIGAPLAGPDGPESGAAYVVFGTTATPLPIAPVTVELSDIAGTNGFVIDGFSAYDHLGWSVASAGDVNGDGIDDVIVGANYANIDGEYAGAAYVIFGSTAGFDSPFEIGELNGSNGFRIAGTVNVGYAGNSVRGVGDVNGDGIDDVILGANYANIDGEYAGAAYVIFGSTAGFDSPFEIGELNGSNGFRIAGTVNVGYAGNSVRGVGDVNGDGIDDVIVGAPGQPGDNEQAGASYVLFGSSQGFAASISVSDLDGTSGVKLLGHGQDDFSGYAVSGAGDFNGDGIDDLLIGAYAAYGEGALYQGATYLVFGQSGPWTSPLSLSALTGENGFRLVGAVDGENSGYSVSAAGDVNGDGYDDVVIGAESGAPNGEDSGKAYVVFGHGPEFSPTYDLGALSGDFGFVINGESAGDAAGRSVSGAGDVNGDGYADLIIGASGSDTGGEAAGAAYIVFGRSGGFGAALELSDLDGANGFKIIGPDKGYAVGYAVSAAGDVNGDGYDDVLLSATNAGPNGVQSGTTYVVFGHSGDFDATFDLTDLDGSKGYRINGASAYDFSGFAVGAAGDVNGDGKDDLIIGAPYASPDGPESGAAYVLFSDPTPPPSGPPTAVVNGLDISDDSNIDDDFVTNTEVQTISGTLDQELGAGEWVEVSVDGGTSWTPAVVIGTSWSLANVSLLDLDTLKARVANVVGSSEPFSQDYRLDLVAPSPTEPDLAAGSDDGESSTDDTTTIQYPTFTGMAEANVKVELYEGATLLGSATADEDGRWSIPSAALSLGEHIVSAKAIDLAGNVSDVVTTLTVTIVPLPPTTVALSAAFSDDTGPVGDDFITYADAQDITGTLSAVLAEGEWVEVSLDDGTTWQTATALLGSDTWSLDGVTLTGSDRMQVRVSNDGGSSEPWTQDYVLDTVVPDVLTGIDMADASDTGVDDTDNITSVTTPRFTGKSEPDALVMLYANEILLGSTTADADGNWSYTASELDPGDYAITAQQGDVAGNLSAASEPLDITILPPPPTTVVDTAAFSADTGIADDFITYTAAQVVSGTLSAVLADGEWVEVSFNAGATWTTASATIGTDTWSLDEVTLVGGGVLMVRVSNDGGSSDAWSHVYRLDQAAPSGPTSPDLTIASDSGVSNTDNVTHDHTPTFRGIAESDGFVTLYEGDTELGRVATDSDGNWSFTTARLGVGVHTIHTVAEDTAGNLSDASTPLEVTILSDVANDANGDGFSDVFFVRDNGIAGTWEMDGEAVGTQRVLGIWASDWQVLGGADVNGDGTQDLLFQNDSMGYRVEAWTVVDGVVTRNAAAGYANAGWHFQATGDFDGDRVDDMLFRHDETGLLSIWRMQDGVAVSGTTVDSLLPMESVLGAGDVTGDGTDDILLYNSESRDISALKMGDGEVQQLIPIVQLMDGFSVLGLGDFDGDGTQDLLLRHDVSTELFAMKLEEASPRNMEYLADLGADWQVADIADYNGDGTDDILLRKDDGTVGAWTIVDNAVSHQAIFGGATQEWSVA